MLTEDQAFAYLSDKHTTLWGDWTIEDLSRRREAAAWLAREANAALSHAQAQHPEPNPLFKAYIETVSANTPARSARPEVYRRLYDAQLPGGV